MGLLDRLSELWRPRPRCVWRASAELGENPVWSVADQALYWIDIPAGTLHRYVPRGDQTDVWRAAPELHALALDAAGRPLVVTADRIQRLDTRSGALSEIAHLPGLEPDCRFNDAACDETGRLWIGSMHRMGTQPLGRLFCIEPNGRVRTVDSGYTISNGPAFAGSGRRLYVADSPHRVIYAIELDADGNLATKRVFARFTAAEGYPDGMTVDTEDQLWVAHYDGWRVTRFNPAGDRVRTVRLPVARVTSCAFGDADLKTLYVTTASAGPDAATRHRQPLAGGLFAVRADATGRPTQGFGVAPAAAK